MLLIGSLDGKTPPYQQRARMYVRAKGKIAGGHEDHLAALAYMSDSYFIGTVARAHGLWRSFPPRGAKDDDQIDVMHGTKDPREGNTTKDMNDEQEAASEPRRRVGMMVSLDHTIYFHNPRHFRADEWMLEEMETPWAGDNRGLVMQKIWSSDGTLIATCIQEVSPSCNHTFSILTQTLQGLLRLQQDTKKSSSSKL